MEFLLLPVLSLLFFSIFNPIAAKGMLRKWVRIINGVVYLMVALLFAFYFVDMQITEKSSSYRIHGDAIFSGLRYDRTEDGYHILVETGLLSYTEIAVPTEQAELPPLSKIYDPIKVYCDQNIPFYSSAEVVEINGDSYVLGMGVVKIVPDYFDFVVIAATVLLIALYVFHLLAFIVVIYHYVQNKRHGRSEEM